MNVLEWEIVEFPPHFLSENQLLKLSKIEEAVSFTK